MAVKRHKITTVGSGTSKPVNTIEFSQKIGDNEHLFTAATIGRSDGGSLDFLRQIPDLTDNTLQRAELVRLFYQIYRREGTINNAITKMAALVAPEGSFKVRTVRGKRGQKPDDRVRNFETALNWWAKNLNRGGQNGLVQGDRGVATWIRRGVRVALIEGSHISREIWSSVEVPNIGKMQLPMNIHTFSTAQVEIPRGLEGTGIDLIYWKPPSSFLNLIRQSSTDEHLKRALEQVIDQETLRKIQEEGKVILDPSTVIHIKNRGTGFDSFGESIIEPALPDVKYKKVLDSIEVTTIEHLINRLVIIKIGSEDNTSPFADPDVIEERATALQNLLADTGPAAMLIWPGPDLSIEEAGAFNSILALDDRYRIADQRLRMSIGVPSVLLTGEGVDGKAAGWAAAVGMAAALREIQDQYTDALLDMARKIGEENGFEDAEIIWEFHDDLLADKEAAANLVMKMFQAGLLDIQTSLEELGFDYDAVATRMAADVDNKYRDEPFGPPKGSISNLGGNLGGGGGEGRPTDRTERDPREGDETQDVEENK